MERERQAALRRSYDEVADEYVARIYDELKYKPLDRELLDRLVQLVGKNGPICDLGCGPGQVARYLRERGASACGVDLSPAMVDAARRLNPGIPFSTGDMLALQTPDAAWGGIAAFYSLVNIPRPDLPLALSEMRRTLRPGGFLLTAFHIGEETVHLDEWWGKAVELDFYFFRTEEITGLLKDAGLTLVDALQRAPYPDVEHPSRRAYVLACRNG
jgi:SAM-dependent methyltransferase